MAVKKNHFILFVLLITFSYSIQAQNVVLQNSDNQNVEIIALSAFKQSDSTIASPLDISKVKASMSEVNIPNENIESEKEATPYLEKKPRIEMFSISRDSIKHKDKKL